ncbi:hypothetical protein ABXJ56_03920 [Microbacterium chocolatum]|uniref:hypothetical protein n=1 Tax=Microbacterium aurantiacum TaxID=162393 RepID=UPI00338F106A
MKFSRGLSARIAVAAAGSLVLAGAAGAAFADEVGNDEVVVDVEISPLEEPGALSMTVAGAGTSLEEVASGDVEIRQFDGVLPTVTVTDTRAVEDVPEGVAWSVTGQASEFTGDAGQPSLPAGHLGWIPDLVNDSGSGEVIAGPEVETVLDEETDVPINPVGLEGQELLYSPFDSRALLETGETQWSANAALFLKTPVDVEPGSYSSTLTLSLFEDVY